MPLLDVSWGSENGDQKSDADDVKDISRIHALSWKSAYKGVISQAYLDELKENFWVSAFIDWIKDNI